MREEGGGSVNCVSPTVKCVKCLTLPFPTRLATFNAQAKQQILDQHEVILGLNAQVELSESRALELSKFAEIARDALRGEEKLKARARGGARAAAAAAATRPQLAALRSNLSRLRQAVQRSRKEQGMLFAHVREVLGALQKGTRRPASDSPHRFKGRAKVRLSGKSPVFRVSAFVQREEATGGTWREEKRRGEKRSGEDKRGKEKRRKEKQSSELPSLISTHKYCRRKRLRAQPERRRDRGQRDVGRAQSPRFRRTCALQRRRRV